MSGGSAVAAFSPKIGILKGLPLLIFEQLKQSSATKKWRIVDDSLHRTGKVSPKPGSLKSLKLVNYKGFENYTINLRATNALVGANNAGKSTALGALRLIVAILPQARRVSPSDDGLTCEEDWP